MEEKFKKEITIFGLRRSGNHAIIEWILSHFNTGFHINDMEKQWQPNKWYYKNGELKEINKIIEADVLIKSYEDIYPNKIDENTIIILRDWYNICASRHFSNRGWENTCNNKSCHKLYLNLCELYNDHKNNFILYNKIIEDESYLIDAEKRLELPNHVKFQKNLPKSGIGKGSSFNNLNNNELNYRYLRLINECPNEWDKIKSFDEINEYMYNIFDIKI